MKPTSALFGPFVLFNGLFSPQTKAEINQGAVLHISATVAGRVPAILGPGLSNVKNHSLGSEEQEDEQVLRRVLCLGHQIIQIGPLLSLAKTTVRMTGVRQPKFYPLRPQDLLQQPE